MNNEPMPERVKNQTGETSSIIRWTVELPNGLWIGAWDKESLDAYRDAIITAERERCAKICEDHANEVDPDDFALDALRYVAEKIIALNHDE